MRLPAASRIGSSFARCSSSRQIFREMGHYLGRAISDLINRLNTESVILSGSVSLASEFFLESLQNTVRENAWPISQRKLLVSNLDDSATMGAGAMVLEQIYGSGFLLNGREPALLPARES